MARGCPRNDDLHSFHVKLSAPLSSSLIRKNKLAGAFDNRAMSADVSDIRRLDLVRTANLKMAKKIRVDPIQRLRLTRMAFRIDRRDPHDPPQVFDSLMIDLVPFPFQDLRHPRRSVKRRLHVLLVD